MLDVGFKRVTHVGYRSNRPSPMDNLIRFKVYYDPVVSFEQSSASGHQDSIYVDIACGIDDARLDTTLLDQEQNLFGFKIPPPLHTLSIGALIADKIPSLGCGTVGYSDLDSTPKQLYDIGMLLRNTTTDDLIVMMQMYNYLTNFKLKHGNRDFGLVEVIQSVKSYISTILTNDTLPRLTSVHSDNFSVFASSMLSKHNMDDDQHLKNVLLTSLCAEFLIRSLTTADSYMQVAEHMKCILDAALAPKTLNSQILLLHQHIQNL